MKRRIKFRGKCADSWIRGDHYTYANGEVIKRWLGSISPEYDVEPETVGQFTGKHDIDGAEIYEGDICEIAGKKVIVLWDENNLKLDFFNLDKTKAAVNLEKDIGQAAKVIGNIFDNPELLEGGNLNENQFGGKKD